MYNSQKQIKWKIKQSQDGQECLKANRAILKKNCAVPATALYKVPFTIRNLKKLNPVMVTVKYGLTLEEACYLYMRAMQWAEGDRFFRWTYDGKEERF